VRSSLAVAPGCEWEWPGSLPGLPGISIKRHHKGRLPDLATEFRSNWKMQSDCSSREKKTGGTVSQ